MNLESYVDFVSEGKKLRKQAIKIAQKISELESQKIDVKHIIDIQYHNLVVIVRVLTVDCTTYTKGIQEAIITFPPEYLFNRNWEKLYAAEKEKSNKGFFNTLFGRAKSSPKLKLS